MTCPLSSQPRLGRSESVATGDADQHGLGDPGKMSLPWRSNAWRSRTALLAQHVREAHCERGSLGAGRGPACLEVNDIASDTNHTMYTMRVRIPWLPKAWGLGAVRMVAAQTPSPASPALVILTRTADFQKAPVH